MTALFAKKKSSAQAAEQPSVKAPVSAETAVRPIRRNVAVGRSVLRAPRVTEKATMLARHNTYVFEVDPHANKLEISQAVASQYNVHPMRVRIVSQRGKQVRWGKGSGQRSALKKALVTLAKGEKLSLYEGV